MQSNQLPKRYIAGKLSYFCGDIMIDDCEKFGKYPEILKESLLQPKYRIVYEGGRIVGRNDIFVQAKREVNL